VNGAKLKFTGSAFKHGLDEESIVTAILNPVLVKKHSDPSVSLLVGFDDVGRFIEVAYDVASRTVFHAILVRLPK
jgi:hypothetical protein